MFRCFLLMNRSAFLLAVALTVSGCGGKPLRDLFMMPTPAAYEDASTPFGEVAAGEGGTAHLDMLYATNRAPATADEKDPYYSGERGYLVRVGASQISFGDSDVTWDKAREISLLKNRPGEFPLRVQSVKEFGVIPNSVSVFTPYEQGPEIYARDARQFADAINARLERSDIEDVFIYVHGYKVIFENPLLVASELWHFLGYEGAFVAFSWPSRPSTLAYFKDIESARLSAWALRKLIDYIGEETNAKRIHIIGYSAGTRVVLNALHEIALSHPGQSSAEIQAETRLGNVILVGSDVDTGVFAGHILDGMLNVQERMTLYGSAGDKALKISEKVFVHRRMGEVLAGSLNERMREFVVKNPQLALVDITGAADFDTGNGHAYFRKSPWVSSDVLMTLRYGLGPEDRGLTRNEGSPIWRFPDDYLARFDAALEKANPALKSPVVDQALPAEIAAQ